MTETLKKAYIEDENGNRASIAYWGSEEKAAASLKTLIDCKNCWNCSGCYGCSGCSRCYGCSDCFDCSGCYGCSGCSRCSGKKGKKGDFTPPSVPVIENIHQRVFEAASQPNALDMKKWHTCGTTHCRAGWVIHLAGDAGYALERFHNTPLAAQLIYKASGFEISPVRFYETNTQVMEDMRRLAEGEAS